MIINLDHVVDIHFEDELIMIYTTDKGSFGLKNEYADELIKALSKYNEIKGYIND